MEFCADPREDRAQAEVSVTRPSQLLTATSERGLPVIVPPLPAIFPNNTSLMYGEEILSIPLKRGDRWRTVPTRGQSSLGFFGYKPGPTVGPSWDLRPYPTAAGGTGDISQLSSDNE